MKAKLSLPERPSGLYLLAVLNVFILLLIFFVLIPSVAQEAGMPLRRMEFESRLNTVPPDKRVALFGRSGPQPRFWLGRKRIEFANLATELKRLKDEKGIEVLVAVLDEDMDFGLAGQLEMVAYEVGIDLSLGGRFEMEQSDLLNTRDQAPKAEVIQDVDGQDN